MKGKLVSVVGLALGLLGLAILSDTFLVRQVMAIPVAPCACSTPSGNTKRCIDQANYTLCKGQSQAKCNIYNNPALLPLDQAPIMFINNDGKIPDGCQDTTAKVNCGIETIQCYRHTRCRWNANTNECESDTSQQQGEIISADKRKEEGCEPGAVCPERAG
jgi:hypothetical protein